MRGDIVMVRAYGGKALLRRVWDVGERVVYVTNDKEFDKLAAGEPAVEPIGFPKEDVFCVSEPHFSVTNPEWSRLEMWSAKKKPTSKKLTARKGSRATRGTV